MHAEIGSFDVDPHPFVTRLIGMLDCEDMPLLIGLLNVVGSYAL